VVLSSRNKDLAKAPNEGTVGPWLTLEHTQTGITEGGYNKAVVQWAAGPAYKMDHGAPASLDKNNRQFRFIDQLLLQPSLQIQALVGGTFASIKVDGAKQTQWGIFGRPVYYLNEWFKLQGDLGYTQVKPKDQDALGMFKATFAPTLTPAPGSEGGFFVRPEIRVFVTYANWNDAAATAGVASGLLGDKKSGFSYGTSVETWF
jgi:maltoporin